MIERCSSYLNFKSVWIIVTAHPHQHYNVKIRRHNFCFTAVQKLKLVKISPSAFHTKYVALDPLIKHISVPPVIEFVYNCSSSINLFFRVFIFLAFTVWKTLKSIGARSGLYCALSTWSRLNKSKSLIKLPGEQGHCLDAKESV